MRTFAAPIIFVATLSLAACGSSDGVRRGRSATKEAKLLFERYEAGPLPHSIQIGDMVFDVSQIEVPSFPADQKAAEAQFASSGFGWFKSGHPWKSGIVPIRFKDKVSQAQKDLFFEACRGWEAVANVKCVPRTNQEDRIDVSAIEDKGCYSQIGRGPGPFESATNMNLGLGCWNKGVIAHELGHAFGLLHEHQRPDRDRYVTVIKQNIAKKNVDDIMSTKGRALGPYDFRSLMHYNHSAFAKSPGLDTLIPMPGFGITKEQLGEAQRLGVPTPLDGEAMASIYGAPIGGPAPEPTSTPQPVPPTGYPAPVPATCDDEGSYFPGEPGYSTQAICELAYGHTLECVLNISNASCFVPRTENTPVFCSIRGNGITALLYNAIYWREPQFLEEEAKRVCLMIDNGGIQGVQDAADAMIGSGEFFSQVSVNRSRLQLNERFYQALLGRLIDPSGLATWVDGQVEYSEVVRAIISSSEFRERYSY
jgi:hypothetical protein